MVDLQGMGPGKAINNSKASITLAGDGNIVKITTIISFDGPIPHPIELEDRAPIRSQITLHPGDVFESKIFSLPNGNKYEGGIITRASSGSVEPVAIYDIDFVDVQDGQKFIFDDAAIYNFWEVQDVIVEGEGPEFGRRPVQEIDNWVPEYEVYPAPPKEAVDKGSTLSPNKGEIKVNTPVSRLEFLNEGDAIRIRFSGRIDGDVDRAEPMSGFENQ